MSFIKHGETEFREQKFLIILHLLLRNNHYIQLGIFSSIFFFASRRDHMIVYSVLKFVFFKKKLIYFGHLSTSHDINL